MWTAIRVEWVDNTPDLDATFTSQLLVRRKDGDWTTVLSQRWEGIMLDFAATFMQDVMTAWLFGTSNDVLLAAKGVHKAARLHRKAHSYD